MWQRIREIVRKEFRQVWREPRMRMLLVLPPFVQLLIFGYAANLDVNHVRLGWVDMDRTPESRELLASFQGSGRFTVDAVGNSSNEAQSWLDRGVVQVAVSVNAGFAQDLRRGRSTNVLVLLDGSDSNTASIAGNYASSIISSFGSPPGKSGEGVEPRVWFNPDLKSRVYFVPGVLANILIAITVMLTAMAIVREKEIGTMEQLMVTPIRPFELIAGKLLPFTVVALFNMLEVTVGAVLVFDVPFRGSLVVLTSATLLFLMTALGTGLFVSTISQTQQQAELASFLLLMPAMMLNGLAFPIRNMPVVIQYLTLLNPARYFLEIVRGVFLKGVGVDVLWPQMLALAVFGVVIFIFSALRFNKQLD